MEKNVFRKSLVIGVIILFMGAVVVPIVNSIGIQKHSNIKSSQVNLQVSFAEYNLTYYGECYISHPIKIGEMAIIYLTYSTEKIKKPVANFWYKTKEMEGSIEIPNYIFLFAVCTFNFDTNMTYGGISNGGYISGFALYISLKYY